MQKVKSELQNIKLENLEDVQFKIEEGAFKPKTLTCSKCNLKMKKTEMEIDLEGGINIRIFGFECSKCKKRYLGLEEARKMDKAMIMSRFIRNDFKMERSLSFDGDNFTFRVPKEFTRDIKKKKIEIMPLGAKQFCAFIE